MEEKDYPMFIVVNLIKEYTHISSIAFNGGLDCKTKSNKKLILLKNSSEGMVLNEDQVKAINFFLECMKEPKSDINPTSISLMITELIKKQNNG